MLCLPSAHVSAQRTICVRLAVRLCLLSGQVVAAQLTLLYVNVYCIHVMSAQRTCDRLADMLCPPSGHFRNYFGGHCRRLKFVVKIYERILFFVFWCKFYLLTPISDVCHILVKCASGQDDAKTSKKILIKHTPVLLAWCSLHSCNINNCNCIECNGVSQKITDLF